MVRKTITIGMLYMLSLPAMALKDDTSKPIQINSATQSLDMQTNTVTFSGNVAITQGSIHITADRVVVTRQGEEQGSEVIEAFGNPITFSQKQDNGKVVKGKSKKLHYELKSEKLILTGKAQLQQQNSSVSGERIVYLVKAQKMEATSSSGSQVVTVLEPSQLRNNQPAAAAPENPFKH